MFAVKCTDTVFINDIQLFVSLFVWFMMILSSVCSHTFFFPLTTPFQFPTPHPLSSLPLPQHNVYQRYSMLCKLTFSSAYSRHQHLRTQSTKSTMVTRKCPLHCLSLLSDCCGQYRVITCNLLEGLMHWDGFQVVIHLQLFKCINGWFSVFLQL